MKKKGLWKKIAATVLTAAMVLATAITTMAAPTITQETGSLQIQKYKTGTTNGIEGVKFSYAQVGEFVLTEGNVNGFTITNSVLRGFLTAQGLQPIANTTNVYDGAQVQDALEKAMANTVTKTLIEAMAQTPFQATNASGLTNEVTNLPIGLYLVVEKEAPAEVTKKADPFIVSVPILEENNGTQSWQYKVLAQPKNDYINEKPDPSKGIVEAAGLVSSTSTNIGDTVTFQLQSNVPAIAGTLDKFTFIDTLSAGLTYGQVVSVKGYAEGMEGYQDIPAANYTVSYANQVLTINFLNPNTAVKGVYEQIQVQYEATLNAQAVVGSTGNKNDFTVSYTNDPDLDVKADPATVNTYGFTLQKQNEQKEALSGATFKLYTQATGGDAVSFYTALDSDNKPTGTAQTEATTGTNGQLSFYGLEEGTYYLEETKAPSGYNTLKNRVSVVVSADTTANGSDITIVNTKGFQLPTTGGMGTVLFTIGGLLIMAAAVILLLVKSRKIKK